MLAASTAEIAAAIGASADRVVDVRGVTIDSRQLPTDRCLFVALPGTTTHGGRFVRELLDGGRIAAAIVSPPYAGSGCLVVDDPALALTQLAAWWRTRLMARVIAVSGSVGKTTTRRRIASALRATGRRVAESPANYNNELGVPLTILGTARDAETLVAEIAAGRPGDLSPLIELLRPTRGVLTAAGPSHQDAFGSVEAVAAEKWRLAEACPTAVCADAWMPPLPADRPPGLSVVAAKSFPNDRPRLDTAFIHVAAEVVRTELEVSSATAASLVESVADAVGGRGQRQSRWRCRRNPGETLLLIDDTYNAGPQSVVAAAERVSIAGRATGRPAILVLGDMLGLGESTTDWHCWTGREIAALPLDRIIAQGTHAASLGDASGRRVVRTQTPDQTAKTLIGCAGAVAIVKGSRGTRMERVFEALRDRGWHAAAT